MTPHTTQSTETTLTSLQEIKQFCGPQSRQAGIVALRRALRRLSTYHVSRTLGDGKRVHSRWLAGVLATAADPSRVNVQTLPRGSNARDPASHACRLPGSQKASPHRQFDGVRCSRTTSLRYLRQLSRHCPIISSDYDQSAAVCACSLRHLNRVSSRPPQASISDQTLPLQRKVVTTSFTNGHRRMRRSSASCSAPTSSRWRSVFLKADPVMHASFRLQTPLLERRQRSTRHRRMASAGSSSFSCLIRKRVRRCCIDQLLVRHVIASFQQVTEDGCYRVPVHPLPIHSMLPAPRRTARRHAPAWPRRMILSIPGLPHLGLDSSEACIEYARWQTVARWAAHLPPPSQ